MRTIVHTSWSTAHPALAANEVGYGTVVNLPAYDSSYLLPDEIEDYMSVNIVRARLHLHLKTTWTSTGAAIGPFSDPMSCLVLMQESTADTAPTSAHGAKTASMSVEEYINGQIAGDGRRNFRILTPMQKWNQKDWVVFDAAGTTTLAGTQDIHYNVDMTQTMREIFKLQGSTAETADIPYIWVLVYTEAGGVLISCNSVDSAYFRLELDWTYKPSQNSWQKVKLPIAASSVRNVPNAGNSRIRTGPGWASALLGDVQQIRRRKS